MGEIKNIIIELVHGFNKRPVNKTISERETIEIMNGWSAVKFTFGGGCAGELFVENIIPTQHIKTYIIY